MTFSAAAAPSPSTPAAWPDALWARIPKTELHCHFMGSVRPQTVAELAARYAVALPRPAEALYVYRDFYDFIDVLRLVARVLRTEDDFARVAQEILADAAASGVRHVELSFNAQYFLPEILPGGASLATQLRGMARGMAAAEREHPISALLITAFDREWGPDSALQTLEAVLQMKEPRVVGVGLDGPERAGPPALFQAVYARARAAGLRRTAHVCEDNQTLEEAPPQHLHDCLDLLDCDRLDHGYNLVSDPATAERARASGRYFCVCGITSVAANRQKRLNGIRAMLDAGLNLTLNTDDPAMFHTQQAHNYRHVAEGLGLDWPALRRLSLAGVDACWLPDARKAQLRGEFVQSLDALEREYGLAAPAQA
jgi:adenosine deaminase